MGDDAKYIRLLTTCSILESLAVQGMALSDDKVSPIRAAKVSEVKHAEQQKHQPTDRLLIEPSGEPRQIDLD